MRSGNRNEAMSQDSIFRRFSSARHARSSRRNRVIRPFRFSLLHLLGDRSVCFSASRQNQNARDVPFEPLVHAQVSGVLPILREILGQTAESIVAAFGRVRGQKGWFVDGYDVRILMQNAFGRKNRPESFERHDGQFCVMFVPEGGVNVNSAGSILSGWVAPSRSKRLRLP